MPIGVLAHLTVKPEQCAAFERAFTDYQRTGFGGWPWASNDPVHPREEGRFARRPDGKTERPA